jgi:N,N'-diacetyllegionaminate synthase
MLKTDIYDFPATFTIDGTSIGGSNSCYIIAEAGLSHLGDFQNVDKLISIAADAKANAIKTQHYYIDELVSPTYSPEWSKRLGEKSLTDQELIKFEALTRAKNLTFLCTPHHETALQFLLDKKLISCIKVGSGERGNFRFLSMVANAGLPIILSTGLMPLEEIKETIQFIYRQGCQHLAILHCVTSYPTYAEDANLSRITQIKAFFPGPVGYSDHTTGNAIPLAAIALGADILEKHITLFTNIPNAHDWKVACAREDLIQLIADARTIEKSLRPNPEMYENNPNMSWAAKSLYAKCDIIKSQIIQSEMLDAMRPDIGINSSFADSIIGMAATRNICKGDLLGWSDFKE